MPRRRRQRPPTRTGWSGCSAASAGRMTFGVDVAPRFDYGRQPHETELHRERRGLPARHESLTVHVGPGARRRAPGAGRVDERDVTSAHADGRQMRGVVLETAAAGRRARSGSPRSAGCSTTPCDFWRVARPVDLPGPVAGDGPPLGDHAEADDLRAEGRPRRGADGGSARAGRRRARTGTTATPGSATRRSRCSRCSDWVSSKRPRGSAAGWATGSGSGVGARAAR